MIRKKTRFICYLSGLFICLNQIEGQMVNPYMQRYYSPYSPYSAQPYTPYGTQPYVSYTGQPYTQYRSRMYPSYYNYSSYSPYSVPHSPYYDDLYSDYRLPRVSPYDDFVRGKDMQNVPIYQPPTVPQYRPQRQMENVQSDMLTTPLEQEGSDPANDILNYWFGSLPNASYFPQSQLGIWFASTPEIDRQIRFRFEDDILAASKGEYNDWRQTPRGTLALVLLLDQFPRRIYADQAKKYVFDNMAKGLVLEAIQKKQDLELYPIERAFFYLPLQHAEDLRTQNLSVSLYRQLLQESPSPLKDEMAAFLQYAKLHRDQIARFGRFPHRNSLLGRKSTPKEELFLKQWGMKNSNSRSIYLKQEGNRSGNQAD